MRSIWTSLSAVTLAKIAAIVVGGLATWVVLRLALARAERALSGGARGVISPGRRQRAATLVRFWRSVLALAVAVGVALSVLTQLGVHLGPLLAGAGLAGAALAFGAQNVLKDYLAGLFVLVEEQYAVGDTVRIGDTTGVVERVGLRVTVLRRADGAIHIVPNGEIKSVTNLSAAPAGATAEITVANGVPVDDAIAALRDAAAALRDDEAWKDRVVGDPEPPVVLSIGTAGTTLRVRCPTSAADALAVERELLRRVKKALERAAPRP